MSGEQRARATAGLVLFVSLCFLGSWFVAATLRVFGLSVAPEAIGTRLFTTSLLYLATMGWQPIVATWVVRRWVDPPDALDLGLRPGARVYSLVGGVGAIALALGATLLATLAALWGGPSASATGAELVMGPSRPPFGILSLSAAFIASLVLVWLQAVAEEIGWRGYLLPRAMERLGRWRGLVLHGAVWGLWYAPVLFFARYGQQAPLTAFSQSLGFVLTCVLLGTLFGWLRLAAKSIVPVVIANATLTLAAGLPYVVHDVDAGLRSAAFGPAGWLLLLMALGALFRSRWRALVQVPERLGVEGGPAKVWVVLRPPPGGKGQLPN